MKVLFVGNSYTYFNDLPGLFAELCRANGREVEALSVTRGGRRLIQNLEGDEAAKELESLLQETAVDVCFLQEQSTLPIVDYPKFEEGVLGLTETYKDRVGKFVLYMTWGRKEGAEFLAEHNLTREEMTNRLADAYEKAAARVGAEVSPVGRRFWAAGQEEPLMELFDPDKTHPSPAGSMLAAMTHYVTLFGELPAKLPMKLRVWEEFAMYKVLALPPVFQMQVTHGDLSEILPLSKLDHSFMGFGGYHRDENGKPDGIYLICDKGHGYGFDDGEEKILLRPGESHEFIHSYTDTSDGTWEEGSCHVKATLLWAEEE